MNRLGIRSFLLWPLLMAFVLLCSVAATPSKGQYINEDPGSLGPGQEWYLIAFDASGVCTRNEGWGYGGGWYYYPLTDTYRQWYYRGPYDSTQSGCFTINAGIVSLDPNRTAYADINYIWSTPQWSALGQGNPPLPNDVPSLAKELQYVASDSFQFVEPSFFGSIEPVRNYTVNGYSPEWVGIEVQGRNVKVLRWVAPVCAGNPIVLGACCDSSSGECYLTEESPCTPPFKWKGAGTTCASCTGQPSATMDFGNAPDSYGTLLSSNGARHVIVQGVYLGHLIDGEADGQPNTTPADDDGVVFTCPLTPGEPTTLTVTASVQGYLNAWVDFNNDGTFSGAGEQIFTDMPLSAGANQLAFNVPASAPLGQTWARFRFNRRGLLSWNGPATDGEVEDYKVSIVGSFEPQPVFDKGPVKWDQSPQPATGATPFVFQRWGELSDVYLGQILADDWQCQDNRPVTGFQWWGTFAGWQESRMPSQPPSAFHIAIWTNNPGTGASTSFAHPDTLVWETRCTNWVWSVAGQANDPRKVNPNETCFEFTCLLSQDQWFYQDPGKGTKTYWLSVAAAYDTNAPAAHPWGWMTGPYSSGNSAVRITALASSDGSTPVWPPSLTSRCSDGVQIKDDKASPQNLAFTVLTNQGQSPYDRNLAPVYRFWSASLRTHFYTISATEKQKLIDQYPDVWTYEGIAFYAYPPGTQPATAKAVYRFRSAQTGHHFYTISETEKNKLMGAVPNEWIYEGIFWYAFD